MSPLELEIRLKNLVARFPKLDLTVNSFLQIVKPTEEFLDPFSKILLHCEPQLYVSRLLFFPRIILNILKSTLISMVRTPELMSWNRAGIYPKETLFISHFTHAQRANESDAFFGKLLDRANAHVFYLNSTRIVHKKLTSFYSENFKSNISFMTKSLFLPKVVSMHSRFFLISLKLFRHSFSRTLDKKDKWIAIEAGVRQHSRASMTNAFFRARVLQVIQRVSPKTIHFTFEGHSHEAILINLIHNNFQNIILAPYQHAPIVPEQFGLMRNIALLGSNDRIYTSGEITRDYFKSFRDDIPIVTVGSSKHKISNMSHKNEEKLRVIGASEGTVQSLVDFLKLFSTLAASQKDIEFQIRVHPAISKKELKHALKISGGSTEIISEQPLNQDLSNSKYCIYRSSAVAIEGLAFGVTPLYFERSRSHALNPLYFANFHLPIFGNSDELIKFFKDISYLDYPNQGVSKIELKEISEKYFSKIIKGFPKDS